MRCAARLNQHTFYQTVDLGVNHRIPLAHECHRVDVFIHDLVRVVSVRVEADAGRTCSLRIALHVHGRYANEENIVEQLVDIDSFCFGVVVFFKIDNRRNAVGAEIAGHSAVFASESAELCHIVLNEGRKGSAEDFFLFLFEFRFACVSVAYECL